MEDRPGLTEPVTELSEFEKCLQQISPEAVAKEREEGEARRKAWEETEHECDEDYLKPCEGTIPICCAANLSPEVGESSFQAYLSFEPRPLTRTYSPFDLLAANNDVNSS